MRMLADTPRPDPWCPAWPWEEISLLSGSLPDFASGTIIGAANRALYLPIIFPCAMTLYAMRMLGENTTGNYDLGFYNENFERLASKGSTAMAATILELALPDLRVTPGRVYYMAAAWSDTGALIRRFSMTANAIRLSGAFREDSALPLPATATPAAWTNTEAPYYVFGVR